MAVTSTLKPLLKWDKPADITYPLTISADMLDVSVAGVEITEVETDDGTGATIRTTKYTRTIPVPGSFAYEYDNSGTWTSFSAGHKFDAGTHQIRVRFTTSALFLTIDGTNIPFAGAPYLSDEDMPIYIKPQSLLVNRGDPGLTWEPRQVDFYLLRNADCPTVPTDAFASLDASTQGEIRYYLSGPEENSDYDPNKPVDPVKNPQYPDCDAFQPAGGYFESGDDITLCCEIDNTVTASVTAQYVSTSQNYKSASLTVPFTVRKPKAEQPIRMFNGLVQKFSCNMGWGGDAGNLQLTLIEDPDAVDENGKPDPALLTFPAVGTACYFLYHGFYFGGVFQRWTYSEGSSGRSYDVVITTPSSLLDGVKLIVDKFQGTQYTGNKDYAYLFPATYEPSITYGTIEKVSEKYQDRKGLMYEATNDFPTNVFNVFAHLENWSMGGSDPNWSDDGHNQIYNSGPSFGFAWTNEDGINAYDTLELLQAMASTPTGERLKSYGDGWNFGGAGNSTFDKDEKAYRLNHFGGLIRFGDSEYELDLRSLISMMDVTAEEFDDDTRFGLRRFRVSGPILDCNSLFKEVTELCQYDYFIEVQMSIKDKDYEEFIENPDYDPDEDEDPITNPKEIHNPIDGYTRGTALLPNHYQIHDGYEATGVGGNGGGPIGVKIDLDESKLLDDDGNPLPLSHIDPLKKRKVIWRTTEDRGAMVVRTMNRQFQPTPGVIHDYILERKRAHGKTPGKRSENAQNDVVSYDIGGELTQNVTQRVVWGAPASRILDYVPSAMVPVWYELADGTPVYDEKVNLAGLIATDGNGFPVQWNYDIKLPKADGSTYVAVLFELRMALAGQESWETFKCFQIAKEIEPNGYTFNANLINMGRGIPAPFVPKVDPRKAVLQKVAKGDWGAQALVPANMQAQNGDGNVLEDMRKREAARIFSVVKKCAENFFMKKFMVPLPMEPGGRWNNQKWESDGKMTTTWEIAGSAWADNPPVMSPHFFDDSGRLVNCCAWHDNSRYDYSDLGTSYASPAGAFAQFTMKLSEQIKFPNGVGVWSTKASVQPKLVWDVNEFNIWGKDFEGTLMAYCDSGCHIKDYDEWTTPDFGATTLAKLFYNIDLHPARYIAPTKDQSQFAVPPNPVAPFKFLVAQQSTRYVWGPWWRWGADPETGQAKNGKVDVVADDNLSPETYGSRTLMDYAGRTKTGTNLALFKEQESGSVVLAQFPQWKIGDRFISAGPYVTDMEVSVGANGSTVKYGFNTWTPQFGKLAQYNLDRIAQIRRNSIKQAKESSTLRPDAKDIAGVARHIRNQRFDHVCHNIRLMVLGPWGA
jgi:hypothetical protein